MKKLLLILATISFLVSCGPKRMGCGPRRNCEIVTKTNSISPYKLEVKKETLKLPNFFLLIVTF